MAAGSRMTTRVAKVGASRGLRRGREETQQAAGKEVQQTAGKDLPQIVGKEVQQAVGKEVPQTAGREEVPAGKGTQPALGRGPPGNQILPPAGRGVQLHGAGRRAKVATIGPRPAGAAVGGHGRGPHLQ